MRIIYLSGGYSPHDFRFLSAIAGAAEQTYFGRLHPDRVYETRPLPEGVQDLAWVTSTRGPSDARAAAQSLRRRVDEIRPDLVHAGPLPSVAYLASQTGFSPLVSMSWGSDVLVEARSEPARSYAAETLARSALAFADCQVVKQGLLELGMPSEKIVVFPWGVDLEQFTPGKTPGLASSLGWGTDTRIVLSARSMEPHYGAEVVVDGFLEAARHDPRLCLLQLGEGSLQTRLQQKVKGAGLEERVHFSGHVAYDGLPAYYHAADIYLTASQADGSSISLLEAMASGLPALVSDIPGNREWVVDDQTGWFFPVGNYHLLAQGLLNAFDNPDRFEGMGKAARQIAERRADWKKSVNVMLAAYQHVISQAGNPHAG